MRTNTPWVSAANQIWYWDIKSWNEKKSPILIEINSLLEIKAENLPWITKIYFSLMFEINRFFLNFYLNLVSNYLANTVRADLYFVELVVPLNSWNFNKFIPYQYLQNAHQVE